MTRVGLVVSVLLTLCLVAWCQDVGELDGLREDRRIAEEEIVLDFSVNYGYAYRARSWAPVDVFVRNDKVDVSGWVEVRLYDVEGAVQSPIYRVRAESPKGSVKRFQLCCYMGTVSRMEVQLYRGGDVDGGGRAVVDFPPYQDLTPIDEQDLMGLVLDDESSGFGFLTEAINTSGQEPLRFHREALSREELLRLAKYAPCYTPFDVIIMGNTEPSRIGRRQRELLYDYVVGGGTIVVCTGEFARWYHRTWVEELAGVEIRAGETVNELDLAAAVFDKAGQVGARGHRDYAVAELTPVLEGVKKFGRDRVLATRRDLGSGRVYVMAVDADSHALQGSLGYKSLWREAVRRRKARRLNYASASSHVGEVLPHISGIVIHSKSSVMTYLALYFGIAIVANWLFFSWLKRREWAWAMLLVFSFGFTAYAVVYGTAGRARTRELYQLELLRVPQGGGMSELRSTVGVLTPRSTTLNLDVSGEYVLAQDLGDVPGAMRRMSNMMRVNRRPFYLQQDGSP
ncbi:MAG: hypothetical protein GWP08_17630, partial [Nitrospiraceae bacterium]|nr:hypothetical protein [Nitrospiraceae bacterium]